MPVIPSRDHFGGCLIGQCLGDALGFPVEGCAPEICGPYVAELRKNPGEHPTLLGAQIRACQYTNDSQLAREWIQSYLACGRFDPVDYAARISAIFSENRIVGRGLATDRAARRLAAGTSWQEAGDPKGNAGNGTAMRAAPVGLAFGHEPAEMARVSHEQGWITHHDPRCSAGSVAIAGAVALAVAPHRLDSQAFTHQLAEWVRPLDALFAEEITRIPGWIALPPKDAAPLLSSAGAPNFNDGWKWISPYVIPSVLWSLYAFLQSPDSYWETVCTTIESGGDVDTTAAMAGAISGAH